MSEAVHPPLQMQAVSKSYRGHPALKRLDLRAEAGSITALLGHNGAGKTTAMSLMNGLQLADRGQVRLWGQSPRQLASRRRMGVMLQRAALPDMLTVAELVSLAASYYPDPMALDEVRRVVGLDAIWTRRYQALSGGQQRAVQFAQAMCGRPPLLLLDEPSVGLDITARAQMWAVIRQLAAGGCAVVLATHHLEEAEAVADHGWVLRNGDVVFQGSLAEMCQARPQVDIRCHSILAPALIASWPGVLSCQCEDGRLHVQASHAESAVAALLAADPELRQLEVRRAGLAELLDSILSRPAILPSGQEAA